MSGSHGYIALPPDGAGKQVAQSVMAEVNFDNGTILFKVGDIVTFSTSTWSGTIIKVEGTITTGELHVRIEVPVPNNPTLTIGENIIVGGSTNAKVSSAIALLYYGKMNIAGKNMDNLVEVTKRNELVTTFTEGSPQFDSFGRMQVSWPQTIGEYTFNYDGRDGHFTDTQTNGATVVHDQTVSCMVLTNPTTNGAVSERMTDIHHKYIPGQSSIGEMTISVGDIGKADVIRRWGLFDDFDGVFFELNGTTLYTVVRSSTSGSVVDTKVEQIDWNTDIVGGANSEFNPSGVSLDLSKDNIFWFDYQWLGAGTVRFGIDVGGIRIICHQSHHANTLPISYMRTGSLPMAIRQENTAISASTSEIRWFCGTIKTEGEFHPHVGQFAYESGGTLSDVAVLDGLIPFLSMRIQATFKGRKNHIMILPNNLNAIILDSLGTSDGYAYLEVWKNSTLTGDTFATTVNTLSGVEIDTAATSFTGGRRVGGMYLKGASDKDIRGYFNYLHENLVNKQDGTHNHYTFAVRAIGADIKVAGAISWEEVRD